MSETLRLIENDVGSSMNAFTTGGETAASPMPNEPSSAVTRTSAASCVWSAARQSRVGVLSTIASTSTISIRLGMAFAISIDRSA